MKNKVKTSLLLLATSMLFALGYTSCSDGDGYSLNDMYGSLATVHKYENGQAESFTLDNGTTLFVAATATSYAPKNERVLINYTLLGDKYGGYDHAIKLNGYIEDILTKPTIYIPKDDKKLQDSIGYNQIKVTSIVARAGFVTIRFGYNMNGKDTHMLNLVALNEDKVQVGEEPIKLEFRHNIGKDEEKYGSPLMFVSFRIDDYIKANQGNKNLAFEVSWKDYSGAVKTETLKYPLSPAMVDPPQVDKGE